jgi:hypothetical protein
MPWLIIAAANSDISWLLTAGERILDGQYLYVDVIETNPPVSVLVCIPGIVVARAPHLPVEMVARRSGLCCNRRFACDRCAQPEAFVGS